jgi:hypothetical protein
MTGVKKLWQLEIYERHQSAAPRHCSAMTNTTFAFPALPKLKLFKFICIDLLLKVNTYPLPENWGKEKGRKMHQFTLI